MGLTIGYKISFKGTAEELHKKLMVIRSKCLDKPFEEVDEIEHTVYSKEDMEFYRQEQDKTWFPNNTPENIAARNKALKDRGLDINTMIAIDVYHGGCGKKHEFMKWGLWAGEGCESTDIEFFKKRTYWRCQGFTKTQYATSIIRCHLLVIDVLDLFKQEGFIVKVNDDGEYWKTRDLEVLAQNINEYTGMLQAIGGVLKEAVEGTDITIDSAIDQCANVVNVKPKIPEN
jgi:hypothetical protein